MMDEIKHLNNYVVNIGTLNSLQEDKVYNPNIVK